MLLIRRYRYAVVTIFSAAMFCYFGLTQYLGAGRDDVFITLYAGEMLATGNGIVNHNGERVEMSSSLFHTLVVAAIYSIAPDYVFTLNKLVGGAAGALAIALLYAGRAVLFPVGRRRFAAFTIVSVLIAVNPAFLYWSFGGLETPFAACFLLAYLIALLRHRFRPTQWNATALILTQFLYCLVRPEGFFLLLFTAVYLVLMKVVGRRRIHWSVLAIPLALFIGLTFFRLSYFGAPLPNTVYAKNGGIAEGLANGFVYLANFYNAGVLLLVALAVQAFLFVRYARHLARAVRQFPQPIPVPLGGMLVFGLALAVQLVVLFSGGDWMEHFRFCVPVIPLLMIMTVTEFTRGVAAVSNRVTNPTPLRAAALVLAAVAVAINMQQSSTNVPRMLPFKNSDAGGAYKISEVLRDPEALDETVIRLNKANRGFLRSFDPFLNDVFPSLYESYRPIVIATGQMGLFPYRIRQRYPDADIRFVDTLGLCDSTIAHLPLPKDPIGLKDGRFVDHVLAGEAGPLSQYVLAQDPNMAYMLGGGLDLTENTKRLNAVGFRLVWDRRNELIFIRAKD